MQARVSPTTPFYIPRPAQAIASCFSWVARLDACVGEEERSSLHPASVVDLVPSVSKRVTAPCRKKCSGIVLHREYPFIQSRCLPHKGNKNSTYAVLRSLCLKVLMDEVYRDDPARSHHLLRIFPRASHIKATSILTAKSKFEIIET